MTQADVQPPVEPPLGDGQDLTAAPEAAAELIPPAVMAQSLPEYVRGLWLRLKSGDSGLLPVLLALIVIVVVFQGLNSKFLTAGNIINLFQQSAVFMMLGMAEVFVLLLGEIDLSAGFVGAVVHRDPRRPAHLQRRAAHRPGLRPLLRVSQPDRSGPRPALHLRPHVGP